MIPDFLVTHSGGFHADELLSSVILTRLFPKARLVRSRAPEWITPGADRIIYVSCDPPTMARDARRLLDAGYGLAWLSGFDLFPNTPHVESVGVFDR